ncbi:MAG: hypothetical protein GEU83_18605 [Pseudonocardiaceae bacterium]|nr:hypothetical protein [Pseudonocardiaceae bacterium]
MSSTNYIVNGGRCRDGRWSAMEILIFAMGALLGLVLGAALCVRYVRQELTASITPRLDVIEIRLGTVHSTVNELVSSTLHAQMLSQASSQPPRHRTTVTGPDER